MVLGVQVAQAAHLAASGGGTGPGAASAGTGGGGGAGAWASRRNGSSMARHGSHGGRGDGPALEGMGVGLPGARYVHAWERRTVVQDCMAVAVWRALLVGTKHPPCPGRPVYPAVAALPAMFLLAAGSGLGPPRELVPPACNLVRPAC